MPTRRHLYFTESWAQVTYWLISDANQPALDTKSAGGHLIGINEGIARNMAQKYLSPSQLLVFDTIPALLSAVCNHGVFAGVIPESPTHASVFRRMADCELPMSPIPGAKLWSGIGAYPRNRGAPQAADLLRREIGNMVDDGTFSTISLKWFGYPTNEAAMVESLSAAHREARRL